MSDLINNEIIAVECQHLKKEFHDAGERIDVLRGVDLQVAAGEMIAIIGASGAGKSTLLQLLGGLDKPTEGNVFIDGINLTRLNESAKSRLRNRSLGFVYQFHHLLPEFNAWENVAMPLLIQGLKAKLAEEKAIDFLQKVGLANRVKHRVGELSGGERQRVAIARALVTNPKCVLADEPTGNLDTETANSVFQLMMQLNEELQTSFVIVTHNENLASKLNRILMMQDGFCRPAS